MEHRYLCKNCIPQNHHVMLADSLLNALIAFSGELSWNDGVALLYSRAVRLALAPYDLQVVYGILAELGLTKIQKPGGYAELRSLLEADKVVFAMLGSGKDSGRMAVFLPDGAELLAVSATDPYQRWISAVWMGEQALVRSRISALREAARSEQSDGSDRSAGEERRSEDSAYFHYFQPNPEARNIGDCVVRALCAVTGERWEAVMRQLSASLDNRNLDFNYNHNFLNLLLDKGFGRCAPTPRINGRLMTGVELCEWLRREYPKGDCRAFAFVGASHVAGVLPEREEGGEVRYRFYDSWDCSSRKITELFLRQDAPAQSAQPAQTPKQRPDDIEPGNDEQE